MFEKNMLHPNLILIPIQMTILCFSGHCVPKGEGYVHVLVYVSLLALHKILNFQVHTSGSGNSVRPASYVD